MRDLTAAQFRAATRRAGFKAEGFLGYFRLPNAPNVSVSAYNVGNCLRDQLAYLHRENDKYAKPEED